MARWVVVGGTGYIGGALCRRLAASGQQVLSVSRASEGPPGCQHISMTLSQNSDFSHLFLPGDRVVYAAGLANRSHCEREPELARGLNSGGPVALAECTEFADSVMHVCASQGAEGHPCVCFSPVRIESYGAPCRLGCTQ